MIRKNDVFAMWKYNATRNSHHRYSNYRKLPHDELLEIMKNVVIPNIKKGYGK
jgi:hypothetical protein